MRIQAVLVVDMPSSIRTLFALSAWTFGTYDERTSMSYDSMGVRSRHRFEDLKFAVFCSICVLFSSSEGLSLVQWEELVLRSEGPLMIR
jgi:hypothetical protein